MKLIFVLVTAASALSSVAGIFNTLNNRIANGGLATPGQFSYVVSITENGRHFCGGFIYSPRWIVTAASCVQGKALNVLNVVAGQLSTINPDVNEQKMVVYTITINPQYNSTNNKQNDIALIRLTADIQFDGVYVDFITYNNVSFSAGIGAGEVMGWGATFEGGLESINLRYGAVTPIPMDVTTTCGGFNNTEFNFTATICASATATGGGSACEYDEGSPFVQNLEDPNTLTPVPTAVGIFSKTKLCAYGVIDAFGIYTRLSVFYSWLLATAGPQPVRPEGLNP